MRRIGTILLIVLSASLLFAAPMAFATQSTPTGDPASEEVEANVSTFLNDFASRISQHDRRVFDLMDANPMSFFFGASDPQSAGQVLDQMAPAKIESIDDVRVLPDGAVTAVVSLSGLLTEQAYFTFEASLARDGGSYRITGLQSHDSFVFPEGAEVREITLTFRPGGASALDPSSTTPSDYVLFKLDNRSADHRQVWLYAPSKYVNDPTAVINGVDVLDGSTASFATVGLDPGLYTLVISMETSTELAGLTIEKE